MEYRKGSIDFYIEGPTAVSLGKFDGLHKGHQRLLRRIAGKKKEHMASVIFTFDFGRTQGLMLKAERRRMLEEWGIDYLLECPFVPEISHMEPEDFVRRMLRDRLHAAYLAVGTDFRFGYQRKGDYKLLQQMAPECGYEIDVVEKEQYNGRDVSSTFIREELERGNIELVNRLLGYPYSVSGEVVHGNALGRTLGIPTLNILPDEGKLLPPNGVYATISRIEGRDYEGISNIGYKPTVSDKHQKGIETYLFDVNENLYGKEVTVYFFAFERPERRFDSVQELKAQLVSDKEWGRMQFQRKESSCHMGESKLR